jgi:hypothetical protein
VPYFIMACHGVYPSASIDHGPTLDDAPWCRGAVVAEPAVQPLVYVLDAERPGNIPTMLDDMAYPVMRDDLVAALRESGVDNLQVFPAIIEDPSSGARHTDYKAFNIIGTVAAADMAKSVPMGTSDSTIIDVDFESLALDESRIRSHRLFRLAENLGAIVVDQGIKEEVERRHIPGMVFYDPADWSG